MSTSRQLSEWEKTKSSRPSRFFWAEWLGCCGRVEPGQMAWPWLVTMDR